MALFVLFLILLLQSQTPFSLCYFINSLDLSFLNFFIWKKEGLRNDLVKLSISPLMLVINFLSK